MGVLAYELLTGQSPFSRENETSKNSHSDISKRILRTEAVIPTYLHPHTQDFIAKLLIKNPRRRLGGGPRDAAELKEHPFFMEAPLPFSWPALERKEVPPPFVPKFDHPMDTSNFAEEFTKMVATAEIDSPAVVPPNYNNVFRVSNSISKR